MIDVQVKVVEVQSGQVLFQCAVEQEEQAYQFAQEMEAMGVEVTVKRPCVSATLASSLGVAEADWQEYQQSMEQEMDDHDCYCPDQD